MQRVSARYRLRKSFNFILLPEQLGTHYFETIGKQIRGNTSSCAVAHNDTSRRPATRMAQRALTWSPLPH